MGNKNAIYDPIPPITSEEERANDQAWHNAPSWAACLALSRAYLRSERRTNPIMGGPICEETHPLLPGLLRLHDYGFLTLESQPREDNGPEVTHSCEEWNLRWYQARQRAWLVFLIPRNEDRIPEPVVRRFCEGLLSHPRVLTRILIVEAGMDGAIEAVENFGHDGYEEISIERTAETEDLLYKAEYEHFTVSAKLNRELYLNWIHHDSPTVDLARPLEVTLIARDWDDDLDMQALVEEVAIKAGLERGFAE